MKIDRGMIWRKFKGRCAYCGQCIGFKDMQVDHIRPKYRGGTDDPENLNPSCRPCNNRKSTLTVDEFKEEICKQVERLQRNSGAFRLAQRFDLISTTGQAPKFYFEGYSD